MTTWIDKKEDSWLDKPQKRERRTSTMEDHDVLIHRPLKCRRCNSRSVRCYGADKPVLYYKCVDCQHKFKVIEKDD